MQRRFKKQHGNDAGANGDITLPCQGHPSHIGGGIRQQSQEKQKRQHLSAPIGALAPPNKEFSDGQSKIQEGDADDQPKAQSIAIVMHPIAARVKPEHHLVQVVAHHQQHRAYVDAQGRPQGAQKPHFSLLPIQELRQIQKCHRQRQLKEIVAIPAKPAEKSFLQQLIFEQAQQQPPNEQPAHYINNAANVSADHAMGYRSLPQ